MSSSLEREVENLIYFEKKLKVREKERSVAEAEKKKRSLTSKVCADVMMLLRNPFSTISLFLHVYLHCRDTLNGQKHGNI